MKSFTYTIMDNDNDVVEQSEVYAEDILHATVTAMRWCEDAWMNCRVASVYEN